MFSFRLFLVKRTNPTEQQGIAGWWLLFAEAILGLHISRIEVLCLIPHNRR
jgi:hypothetical protein